MPEPATEGVRRYPETSGHTRMGDLPCTCLRTCMPRCAGECGCEACRLTFTVFCDEAGLGGFQTWTQEDRKNALSIYRDTSTPFPFHPALEGFKRYPEANGRYGGNPDLPCKCGASCESRCVGACGYEACAAAFAAFALLFKTSGVVGEDSLSVSPADARSAYRLL